VKVGVVVAMVPLGCLAVGLLGLAPAASKVEALAKVTKTTTSKISALPRTA
jgi:hypothetical protein